MKFERISGFIKQSAVTAAIYYGLGSGPGANKKLSAFLIIKQLVVCNPKQYILPFGLNQVPYKKFECHKSF